ncbi:MAG: GTP 3',8-cyclase MoaA [Kineosporiaceae bacterium]
MTPRPPDPRLIDTFGRVATDLRVSLTDRCNLRCSYCMPPEGLDWMPDPLLLTDAELIRLITIAVERLGVDEVRFTGGEPLLRKGLEDILGATTALRTASGAVPQTALTTNGLGLDRRAPGLVAAGLHRINVSLDTLDRARFARITHRDRMNDVLAGLRAATDAGLDPVKINTVLIRGVNDDEAADLLRWAIGHGYELRFIEQMPLDAQGAWDRDEMVTAAEILTALQAEFTLTPTGAAARGAAPAETWLVDGDAGLTPSGRRARVGVVGSVTRPFCGDCDRTRLTADGQVRTCLFSRTETDLRALLRADADDELIARAWRTAMWGKFAGHGIDDPSFLQPDRPMSAIGG